MSTRDLRRTVQAKLENSLDVVVGSIGSGIRYNLKTCNLSSDGFFLEFSNPNRFPFTDSTMLEVWLKLRDNEVVFFNGKIVRTVLEGDEGFEETGPGLSVRIIQIATDHQTVMEDFIHEFESDIISQKNAS